MVTWFACVSATWLINQSHDWKYLKSEISEVRKHLISVKSTVYSLLIPPCFLTDAPNRGLKGNPTHNSDFSLQISSFWCYLDMTLLKVCWCVNLVEIFPYSLKKSGAKLSICPVNCEGNRHLDTDGDSSLNQMNVQKLSGICKCVALVFGKWCEKQNTPDVFSRTFSRSFFKASIICTCHSNLIIVHTFSAVFSPKKEKKNGLIAHISTQSFFVNALRASTDPSHLPCGCRLSLQARRSLSVIGTGMSLHGITQNPGPFQPRRTRWGSASASSRKALTGSDWSQTKLWQSQDSRWRSEPRCSG